MDTNAYGPLGLWAAALGFSLRILYGHLPRSQVDWLALGTLVTGMAGTGWAAWQEHVEIQARARRRMAALEAERSLLRQAMEERHAAQRARLQRLREETFDGT